MKQKKMSQVASLGDHIHIHCHKIKIKIQSNCSNAVIQYLFFHILIKTIFHPQFTYLKNTSSLTDCYGIYFIVTVTVESNLLKCKCTYISKLLYGVHVYFILFHFLPVSDSLFNFSRINIFRPAPFHMVYTPTLCFKPLCVHLEYNVHANR